MGVDRARLGSAEDIHRRFLNAIRSGDQNQRSISLGITLDERLIGYTLLNRYSEDVNYSHWHIIVSGQRQGSFDCALPLSGQSLFRFGAPLAIDSSDADKQCWHEPRAG